MAVYSNVCHPDRQALLAPAVVSPRDGRAAQLLDTFPPIEVKEAAAVDDLLGDTSA